MIKKLCLLCFLFLFSSCFMSSVIKTQPDFERYYNRYQNGKIKNIDKLVATYHDEKLPENTRLTALKYIILTKDPAGSQLISKLLDNQALTLKPEEVKMMLEALLQLKDPAFTPLLMRVYMTYLTYHMEVQNRILDILYASADPNRIANFLDMYERSQEAYLKLDQNMTRVLGKFGDDSVVPVLISIVNNPKANMKLRESAIQMLAKKDNPALAQTLTDLLGTPDNDLMIRDFAFNVLETGQDEKILLALLNFMQNNKDREYKMMQTVMEAISNYDNPAVIPSLLYIIKTPSFRKILRDQAVTSILKFNRPDVLDQMMDIFSSLNDYQYWPQLSEAVAATGNIELRQKLEKLALKDQLEMLGSEK